MGLCLSRKVNESIELPGLGITIWVDAIRSAKVRLRIEAPPEVRIARPDATCQTRRTAAAELPGMATTEAPSFTEQAPIGEEVSA